MRHALQRVAGSIFPRRGKRWGIAVAVGVLLLFPAVSHARMGMMTDAELAAVTGHGFSNFSLENGVARIDLGIAASTFTEIDSVKLGYWDNGGGKGWDQNWTGAKLGSSTSDLTFNGFFLKAVFDPATINDPANRQLQGITMGSQHVTGTLTADFESLSRIAGGVAVNNRALLGNQTYRFNDTELSISVNFTGPNKGIWVNFGNATVQ